MITLSPVPTIRVWPAPTAGVVVVVVVAAAAVVVGAAVVVVVAVVVGEAVLPPQAARPTTSARLATPSPIVLMATLRVVGVKRHGPHVLWSFSLSVAKGTEAKDPRTLKHDEP
jgi:hypothetical protein